MLVYADEPHHRLQRRIVSKALTPRMVALIEPRVRELCNEFVDSFGAAGHVDVVPAYANALPGTVFSELLGVPPADRDQFKRWAEVIVAAFGGDSDAQLASVAVMGEISVYFMQIIGECRAVLADRGELPDDLLTAMLVSDYEGRTFDDTEMMLAIHIFLVGGHETTASGIAGAIHLLAAHPDQLERLRADRSLLGNAVEEVLRHESPVQCMFRTPTSDTGVRPNGDDHESSIFEVLVMMWLPEGAPRPKDSPLKMTPPDEPWGAVAELGGLGPIIDQDMVNLVKFQRGIRSDGITQVHFANYQERNIRNLHQNLEQFISD